MGNIKIPFGWHKREAKWKDPGSVLSGLACGCYCHACGEPLQAVHPRRRWRSKWVVKYFRHAVKTSCDGGLESLVHILAKTLFKGHSSVFLPNDSEFFYDTCEVETPREGKRPDIYLINSRTGEHLVVEIFYSHRTEESTLAVFREKDLRVMEIDISSIRKAIPSTEAFERMVLKDAPRKILVFPQAVAAPAPAYKWESSNSAVPASWAQRMLDWWEENLPVVVLLVVGVFVGYRLFSFLWSKPMVVRRRRRR